MDEFSNRLDIAVDCVTQKMDQEKKKQSPKMYHKKAKRGWIMSMYYSCGGPEFGFQHPCQKITALGINQPPRALRLQSHSHKYFIVKEILKIKMTKFTK